MQKLSTLIYVVNKFTNRTSEFIEDGFRNFLTTPDEEPEFSPSAAAVKNIMDFASAYEVLESKSAGQIELVIN